METRVVYAAKYWDTVGIEQVEVQAVATPSGFYIPVDCRGWQSIPLSFKDTFATLEEARLYVARRRLAKLKSLDRMLKKFEAINPETMVPKPRVKGGRL